MRVAEDVSESRQCASRLAALRRLARAAEQGAPISESLRTVAQQALDVVGASTVAIGLRGQGGAVLDFIAVAGENVSEMLGLQIDSGRSLADEALQTGRPAITAALDGPTRVRTTPTVSIPIMRQGHAAGVLVARGGHGAEPFDARDVGWLQLCADYATLAMDASEMHRQAERKDREISVLYDAARTISSSLNVQDVVNCVLDTVCDHFEHNAAVLFLLNDEKTHLFIAGDRGLGDEEREVQLAADGRVTSTVLETGQPLLIEGAALDRDLDSVAAPTRTRTAIVSPIRSRNDTLGLLLVMSSQPDAYSPADADLLGAVGAQAGIAIANAWLYEDATRRAEEAGTLYDLSQHVNGTLHLDRALHIVADSAVRVLKVDRFAILLRGDTDSRLAPVVTRGFDGGEFEQTRWSKGEGIPGWVYEWMTPTAVADLHADARNAAGPLDGFGVVSAICVPLASCEDDLGVMLAMSSRRRLFTVAEMELLYTIANQASAAISNANLYHVARTRSMEMRRYLRRVAAALAAAMENRDLPQLMADMVAEVMHADRCAIYHLEGDSLHLHAANRSCSQAVPDSEVQIGEGLAGAVARRGRPLAVPKLGEDPRAAAHEWISESRLASYLALPLRSNRKVVGVVEIYTRHPRTFADEEVKHFAEFVRHAHLAERLADC